MKQIPTSVYYGIDHASRAVESATVVMARAGDNRPVEIVNMVSDDNPICKQIERYATELEAARRLLNDGRRMLRKRRYDRATSAAAKMNEALTHVATAAALHFIAASRADRSAETMARRTVGAVWSVAITEPPPHERMQKKIDKELRKLGAYL